MNSNVRRVLRIATVSLGVAAMAGSLLGHIVVVFCLFRSWDAVAAVTVFPIWIWAIFGMALALVALMLTRSKLAYFAAAIWIITVLIGADERRSLMRGLTPTLHGEREQTGGSGANARGIVLRVATINSKKRNIEAVREVRRFNPDIVFVQEAPPLKPLVEFAKEMWGDEGNAVGAYYCSILAKGELEVRRKTLHDRGICAMLTLEDGRELEVMSIHLQYATTRWDLWNPSCWREHRDLHRKRRTQLETLLSDFETNAAGRPRLFGGDFNAPPTSNLFDAVPDRYANAFGAAGRGLGNTFINGFPVLRIDHIYAGPGFDVLDSRAARTEHSDHRMVVADLLLETGTPTTPAEP